jgi:hypothetical protein
VRPLHPFGLKLGTCSDGGAEAGSEGALIVAADVLGLSGVNKMEKEEMKEID